MLSIASLQGCNYRGRIKGAVPRVLVEASPVSKA
jgi:hypothetical protein